MHSVCHKLCCRCWQYHKEFTTVEELLSHSTEKETGAQRSKASFDQSAPIYFSQLKKASPQTPPTHTWGCILKSGNVQQLADSTPSTSLYRKLFSFSKKLNIFSILRTGSLVKQALICLLLISKLVRKFSEQEFSRANVSSPPQHLGKQTGIKADMGIKGKRRHNSIK